MIKETEKYYFKQIDENEFSLLEKLYFESYGRKKSNEYFQWKFLENPSGIGIGFMAFHKKTDAPAAFYAFLPQDFQINKSNQVFLQSCNGMTHPDHQRNGLFKILHEIGNQYLEDNNLIGISYSGQKTLKYKLSTGWESFTNVRTHFWFPKLAFLKRKTPNVQHIENLELIAPLLKQITETSDLSIIKTVDIYQWRLKNPERDYKLIGWKSSDKYESYLVYTIENSKVDIFDFYFGSKSQGKEILHFLKNIAKNQNLKGIVSLAKENSYYSNQLKKNGFWVNKRSFGPLRSYFPFSVYLPKNQIPLKNFKELDFSLNSFEYDAY